MVDVTDDRRDRPARRRGAGRRIALAAAVAVTVLLLLAVPATLVAVRVWREHDVVPDDWDARVIDKMDRVTKPVDDLDSRILDRLHGTAGG